MEEWLRKLLASVGGQVQGTPPFAPSGGPPTAMSSVGTVPSLASVVNRPVVPPAASNASTAEIDQHHGVPSPNPQVTNPNVRAPVSVLQAPPPGTPSTTPSASDQLQSKLAEYNTLNQAPAQKQNKWLQALFLGLQGAQRIADPTQAQNLPPVQWLGEAKKSAKLQKIAGQIGPLETQVAAQQAAQEQNLKTRKTQADIAKEEEEVTQSQYERAHPGMEVIKGEDGIYERPKGSGSNTPYTPVKGIAPPEKTEVKLPDGTSLKVTPVERLRYEQSKLENDTERMFQTGKINQEQRDDYRKELDKWSESESARNSQITTWVNEALAKGDKARALRERAKSVEGTKEALDMNNQADQLAAESQQLFNNAKGSTPIPKPTAPKEFVPPTGSVPAGVSKAALTQRLRERGIKENSDQWKKVMSKAGF